MKLDLTINDRGSDCWPAARSSLLSAASAP